MSPNSIDPAANLRAINEELNSALKEAGRKGDAVTITAVTKKQNPERILLALAAGQRVFGENRVQEAQEKWPALRGQFPDIELRLIGPLQSNKAADAVRLFDVIETVDRPKIARALAQEMEKQGRRLKLLVQVNIGEEDQKAGVAPREADAFLTLCHEQYGLTIDGLMCIPPADEGPSPYFALLAKIAARNNLAELSMGMSADYVIAAQLGASSVRIGTGIFGPRP